MNPVRVVVTGIGLVTPLGLDTPSTWKALLAGTSGIDHITTFDAEEFETQIAAEVKGFDPTSYMEVKEARHVDRFSQLAIAASREAMSRARLEIGGKMAERVAVLIGSGVGGIQTLSQQMDVLREKERTPILVTKKK